MTCIIVNVILWRRKMLKHVLCFSTYILLCFGCGPLMKVIWRMQEECYGLWNIFQYAFIAPVQPGDDYSDYDMNRYKDCFYVGMFRGISKCGIMIHEPMTWPLLYRILRPDVSGWLWQGYDDTQRQKPPRTKTVWGHFSWRRMMMIDRKYVDISCKFMDCESSFFFKTRIKDFKKETPKCVSGIWNADR